MKEIKYPCMCYVGDSNKDIVEKENIRLVIYSHDNGFCVAMAYGAEECAPTNDNTDTWEYHLPIQEPKKRPMTIEEIADLPYIVCKRNGVRRRWVSLDSSEEYPALYFGDDWESLSEILEHNTKPNGEPLEIEI